MQDDLAETGSELPLSMSPSARGLLPLQQLKAFYREFRTDRLDSMDSVYTADVEFRDPVHTLHGCLALRHYLRKLAENLQGYHIRYLDEVTAANAACLTWEMSYSHPQINKGQLITLRGMTQLKFTDKVYYHEDCYDLGALLYDHVPLLGFATRSLKQRLAG